MDILQAVSVILEASEADILSNQEELEKAIHHVRKIFAPTSARSLVNTLERNRREIEAHCGKSVEDAIKREVSWHDTDERALDIKNTEHKDDPAAKFCRGFAQISLADQLVNWVSTAYGEDLIGIRLHEVATGEGISKRDGKVTEFIKVHGLPKQSWLMNAIKDGVKFIVFQSLTGVSSHSAVLFFAQYLFREVPYSELPTLQHDLSEIPWIKKLTSEKADWFEDCRKKYDGKSSKYLRTVPDTDNDIEGIKESNLRQRKRHRLNKPDGEQPTKRSRREGARIMTATEPASHSPINNGMRAALQTIDMSFGTPDASSSHHFGHGSAVPSDHPIDCVGINISDQDQTANLDLYCDSSLANTNWETRHTTGDTNIYPESLPPCSGNTSRQMRALPPLNCHHSSHPQTLPTYTGHTTAQMQSLSPFLRDTNQQVLYLPPLPEEAQMQMSIISSYTGDTHLQMPTLEQDPTRTNSDPSAYDIQSTSNSCLEGFASNIPDASPRTHQALGDARTMAVAY